MIAGSPSPRQNCPSCATPTRIECDDTACTPPLEFDVAHLTQQLLRGRRE